MRTQIKRRREHTELAAGIGPQVAARRPLCVVPQLKSLAAELSFQCRSGTPTAEGALKVVQTAFGSDSIDSVTTFESVLNGILDSGYREPALMGFIYDVLRDRFAARIRRRLTNSRLGASVADVEDLVGVTTEAVHALIRNANRERHTITYALLLSISDHRAIDYLRRKRPELSDSIEGFHTTSVWRPDGCEQDRPDNVLVKQERQKLARALRAAVLDSVNRLPDDQRRALILVEVSGLGYEEIAEKLGVKRTDVGNLVRRARLNRDRNLMPLLRTISEFDGFVGFGQFQQNRTLRINLLRWTTEMGDGVCGACLSRVHKLHTGNAPCFESGDEDAQLDEVVGAVQ
jgi:RNA polymerase sigma factor (sigma-70 family)